MKRARNANILQERILQKRLKESGKKSIKTKLIEREEHSTNEDQAKKEVRIIISINIKKEVEKSCPEEKALCSLTFMIKENLDAFNNVINIFTEHNFTIQDFVDDYMCILSREQEGMNEAVKIFKNEIQIKAWRKTLLELCEPLSAYCKTIVK